MLVEMAAGDLAIITAHYNRLLDAEYATLAQVEALPAQEVDINFASVSDSHADLIATAKSNIAFFIAEIDRFSLLITKAQKSRLKRLTFPKG